MFQVATEKVPLPSVCDGVPSTSLTMPTSRSVPQQRQIEVDTIEHPTEFKIEIIETLKGYSDADVDTAIDTYVENQRK